ncbi:hypothetical protein ACFL6O_04285 [candidate division KSB1 bacterium]
MKWIEIIELRSVDITEKLIEKDLKKILTQLEKESEKYNIKVYMRVMIDTDYSIHLFHESNIVENSGSTLGLRLVSALKSYGLVNHTIWVEKPKDSLAE